MATKKQKFDIASLGLFGRNEEVATLRNCFKRMTTNTHQKSGNAESTTLDDTTTTTTTTTSLATTHSLRSDIMMYKELVLISGNSGVGKSSLSRCLKADVDASENGLFVEGKFDLITSNEPYKGVSKAYGMICKELLSSQKESVASVGRMMSNFQKEDIQVLFPLIPELKAIVAKYHTSQAESRSKEQVEMGNTENCQERWKYAFRVLNRALNAAFSPLVLVLDDLQWSDLSSLQVINYLVSDMQNPNQLMIIGCYRSEETREGDTLWNSIKTLKEKQEKSPLHVMEIKLNSCNLDHVNQMIMTLLSVEDEGETRELAKLVYKRTLGNPFFVLQFIMMLEKEGLVQYDEANRWVWEVEEIKQRTKFMSDVVDLLQGRMSKLSEDVQLLLPFAACLGESFAFSTIDIIWREHGTDESDIHGLLDVLIEEQFIEASGNHGYRWIHDKVQEAAISLSGKVNASFKFKIGKTLLSALDDEQLENDLFDVVDLINRGNVGTRPELAALNFKAAQKAHRLSAFQSAAKYVEFGAALLPRDHWISHRDLTLDLFLTGTEVEVALGNDREAAGYCNAVFQREDCTTMEKVPFQMAVIAKLCNGDGNMKKKALDMCMDVLKSLRYPVIWNQGAIPLQAVIVLVNTVKATKKRMKDKNLHSSLDEMTDPRHLVIMQLLGKLGYVAYHLELTFLCALCIGHQVNMTLKHGTCDLSAKAFADIGFVSWAVLKEDFSVALDCNETALALQPKLSPQYEAQQIWHSHTMTLCWLKPLDACCDEFQRAYSVAMRVGDIEYACWNLLTRVIMAAFVMSRNNVPNMLKDCDRLVKQMEELQQMEQACVVKLFWQYYLCIANSSGTVTQLDGPIFSAKKDPVTKGPLLGGVHLLEGELLFLESFEKAAERAIKYGERYFKLCPGIFVGALETFHRGVALYAMARKRRKRKFKSRAIKIHKTIKQWIKAGNPNIEHYGLLLDAEHASLSRKKLDEADVLYQNAIGSAKEIGHLQHCGLCNERYADFLLECRSDQNKAAMHRISEAIRYYQEWGALGKVHQLQLQMKKVQ